MALIPLGSSTFSPLKIPISLFKTSRYLPFSTAIYKVPQRETYKNNDRNKLIFRYLCTRRNYTKIKTPALISSNFNGGRGCFGNYNSQKHEEGTGGSCNYYITKSAIHSSSNSSPTESPPENKDKERWLPSIMPFPPVMWPRFINSVRNWFFIHFVIKPYFDREFDLREFDRGARQAVSFVSNKLSSGEFDDLAGIVEASALEEIKKSVSTFSLFQRDLIKVAVEDVFFTFPYQIGIIIPDQPINQVSDRYIEDGPGLKTKQVRHVEITVVMHVLRGYAEKQKAEETKSFVEFVQDDATKYNVMVCNYRFFRDFTEGVKDPTWIINMVNHFLPSDIQRIQQRQQQ